MFGQKLRALRKHNSLTQADLGKKIGVSPSAVGMYEQGHREPDHHTLLKICDLFNVPTDYLINTKCERSIFLNENNEQDLISLINLLFEAVLKHNNVTYHGNRLEQQDVKKLYEAIKMATVYSLNKDGFK